jgi:hypothetical protein
MLQQLGLMQQEDLALLLCLLAITTRQDVTAVTDRTRSFVSNRTSRLSEEQFSRTFGAHPLRRQTLQQEEKEDMENETAKDMWFLHNNSVDVARGIGTNAESIPGLRRGEGLLNPI